MGHESWEMVPGTPHPALRDEVLGYTGYAERSGAPLRRLQVATTTIPLILSFGPPILIDDVRHTSFLAGLDDRPAMTEHAGEQLGVQVNLSPLGARRLLGTPMSDVAGRVVSAEDLLGRDAGRLVERLCEAPGWDARFALLDRVLLGRLQRAAPVAAEVEYAWRRLRAACGAVSVEALAGQVGWSRRHLAVRFRADVGLPPKAVARLLRFERVTALLRAGEGLGLAEAAYECGYADQAHLNRDFRVFAGTTPTDYAARLLPGGHGVAGEVTAALAA